MSAYIVCRVLKELENSGYVAYLVGGCVRDSLLGIKPHDYDIATNALPEEVEALFPHTIPTGKKHGTITVIQKGMAIEVTTFRTESDYQDYRRPQQVQFVASLASDCARRDFTINAMAKDRRGKLYDYFGGREDLSAKKIRAVGNPDYRFQEDPLRILRAIRFRSQLGFSIERGTWDAMVRQRHACQHIAVERVVQELHKLWCSSSSALGCQDLLDAQLLNVLPPFRDWKWRHLGRSYIARIGQTDDPLIRWAFFIKWLGVPVQSLNGALRSLRLSKEMQQQIASCFRLSLAWSDHATPEEGKRWLIQHGLTTVMQAQELQHLCSDGKSSLYPFQQWYQEMPIKTLQELAIDGSDLIRQVNRPPGPWIHQTLQYLLEQVALQRIRNQTEDLMKEGYIFANDS